MTLDGSSTQFVRKTDVPRFRPLQVQEGHQTQQSTRQDILLWSRTAPLYQSALKLLSVRLSRLPLFEARSDAGERSVWCCGQRCGGKVARGKVARRL